MRKKIYKAKISYKWRVVRHVKGVRKPAKTWKESKVDTCVTDIEPKALESNNYFIKGLKIKHKSTQDIEVKVIGILYYQYLCMSNDIY